MSVPALAQPPVDFLAVGHICHDLVPGGRLTGGAAAYSSLTAVALGLRAGVVTSAADEDDWAAVFPQLAVTQVPAPATTVFENVYTPAGRVQTLHAVAGRLLPEHVPAAWTRAPIVLLGPIANEIDPAVIHLFSDSIVGVGPQGWLRRWDADGRVWPTAWEGAAEVLPLAAVTFLSEEDLLDAAMLDDTRRLARIVVLTQGERGCTVFCRDEARAFPAPPVEVVDPTGAGDIFAAAYLVRFYQTDGNAWAAAEFANTIAAHAITRRGLPAKSQVIRQALDALMHNPAAR